MHPTRVLVLVLSVAQLIAPDLIPAAHFALRQPLIYPPRPFFSLWRVISSICFVYGIVQLHPSQAAVQLLHELAASLEYIFAFSVLRLLAIRYRCEWHSAGIFAAILALLCLDINSFVLTPPYLPVESWLATLISLMLGIYAGWATCGVWFDLATAIAQNPATSPDAQGWQAAILACATASSVAGVVYFRALLPYTLTVIYALSGAALGSWRRGGSGLAGVALTCALLVAIVAFIVTSE